MKVKDLVDCMGYGKIRIHNYENNNWTEIIDCNDLPDSILDCNVYQIMSNLYKPIGSNVWVTFIDVVLDVEEEWNE